MERETGIEPATNGLGSRYSTIELLPHGKLRIVRVNVIAKEEQDLRVIKAATSSRELRHPRQCASSCEIRVR
jgi:hypothetical protein